MSYGYGEPVGRARVLAAADECAQRAEYYRRGEWPEDASTMLAFAAFMQTPPRASVALSYLEASAALYAVVFHGEEPPPGYVYDEDAP